MTPACHWRRAASRVCQRGALSLSAPPRAPHPPLPPFSSLPPTVPHARPAAMHTPPGHHAMLPLLLPLSLALLYPFLWGVEKGGSGLGFGGQLSFTSFLTPFPPFSRYPPSTSLHPHPPHPVPSPLLRHGLHPSPFPPFFLPLPTPTTSPPPLPFPLASLPPFPGPARTPHLQVREPLRGWPAPAPAPHPMIPPSPFPPCQVSSSVAAARAAARLILITPPPPPSESPFFPPPLSIPPPPFPSAGLVSGRRRDAAVRHEPAASGGPDSEYGRPVRVFKLTVLGSQGRGLVPL